MEWGGRVNSQRGATLTSTSNAKVPETSDLMVLARQDLNLLPPLHALLEEKSVTRAAQRIGLSQPAMSHILARCRKLLFDELLVRVGSVMELSTRARELRVPLGEALEAVREVLIPEGAFDPASSRRQLSIAVSTSTATTVIPPLARRLSELAPGISLSIRRSLLPTEDLQFRPDIDLAILPDNFPSPHGRISFYSESWMAIVDKNNMSVGDELTIEQISALDHMAYWSDGPVRPYQALEEAGVKWRTRVAVHDFLALLFLVEGTDAMAIVPRRLARTAESRGRLRSLELPIDVGSFHLDLVWNPRLRLDPIRLWLTHVLKDLDTFGDQESADEIEEGPGQDQSSANALATR